MSEGIDRSPGQLLHRLGLGLSAPLLALIFALVVSAFALMITGTRNAS